MVAHVQPCNCQTCDASGEVAAYWSTHDKPVHECDGSIVPCERADVLYGAGGGVDRDLPVPF